MKHLVVWVRTALSPWTGDHLAKGLACLSLGVMALVLDNSWWGPRWQGVLGRSDEHRVGIALVFLLAGGILLVPAKCRLRDVPPCSKWKVWLYYLGSVAGSVLLLGLGLLITLGSLRFHSPPLGIVVAIWGGHRLMALMADIWDRRLTDRDRARDLLHEARLTLGGGGDSGRGS